LALSAPIFDVVRSQPEYLPLPVLPLLSLLLFYQFAPLVGVFALDWLLASSRLSRYTKRPFRSLLFFSASLSILRQAQVVYLPDLPLLDLNLKVSLALAVIAVIAILCWRARRAFTLFFLFLSPLALILTGVFLVNALGPERAVYGAKEQIVGQSPPLVKGPIFILLFDMLGRDVLLTPEGEIDQARFPNFASLAKDAAWFTNATSNNWLTCDAVPTLLTGRLLLSQSASCFDRDGFQNTNVLSRLAAYYQITTSGVGLSYCFSEAFICLGGATLSRSHPLTFPIFLLEDIVVHLVPRFTGVGPFVAHHFYISHRWSLLQFEELLDSIRADQASKQLYYFHSFLPHYPFVFDENGNRGNPVGLASGKGTEEMYISYGKQVQFVDLLLGRLLQQLVSLGLYDQSTIIVTSDNGLPLNIGESSSIPLLIKSPGVQPQVLDIDYQHLDFSNTLLDVLGLQLDDGAEGVSVFAERRPLRDKVFYFGASRYVYDGESDIWRLSPSASGRQGNIYDAEPILQSTP
jgi:hypothetical protein